VALSTAILAVLAAIASLLSGEHANEAMMNQIEASDQWGHYQAKSIKAAVLDAKTAFTGAEEADQSKRARYEKRAGGQQIGSRADAGRSQVIFFTSTSCLRGASPCSKSQLPSLQSLRSQRSAHSGR
jgi:hypothetical protein